MIHYSRSVMSRYAAQINLISARAVIVLLSALCLSAAPAYAKSVSKAPSEIHKVSFDGAEFESELTLNWRRPDVALAFQIPDNDWVDSVELLLTMRPAGTVRSDTPLLVTFNGGVPVPIESEGHGFDARLDLDPSRLQGQRNQITVSYQKPTGEACIGPGHGAWDIDIKSSYVVIKSRAKSRALGFHDVKTALGLPATAPKSVAILASGPKALQFEVLAAQGLARNMDTLPAFQTKRSGVDLEIIAATRSSLTSLVRDKTVLQSGGSQIAITKSGVMQIVLTGDTDAEVLSAVKAFAAFNLPRSRSTELTPDRYGRLDIAGSGQSHISGKTTLTTLGLAPFSADWAPRAQHIHFHVADPAASSGTLTLHAKTGPFVAPSSALTASLNGKSLGKLPLVKRNNHITIDIPRGILQGRHNHLVLTPDLHPAEAQPTCAGARMGAGFSLSPKSVLQIVTDDGSSDVNLSRFAASGAPFSDDNAKGVSVIINARNSAEKNAALKIMAKLGKASGHPWSDAVFLSGAPDLDSLPGHALFIGSQNSLDAAHISGAPKGLKVAIGGTAYQAPVTMRSAANDTGRINLLSARESVRGGVAALYRDPLRSNRVVGVITQTHGQSFARAAAQMTDNDHWNQLQGSVARWNDVQVMMAQTAMTPPQTAQPSGFKLPSFARNISMPDTGAWGAAAANQWQSFTQMVGGWAGSVKSFMPSGKTQLSAPLRTQPLQTRKLQSETASIPIPSLKRPSRTIAAPLRTETPRHATPKIRAPQPLTANPSQALVPIRGQISAGYASASDWVTQTVDRTDLGRYRANDASGLNLLVMALIAMGVLIAFVFIAPNAGQKASRH